MSRAMVKGDNGKFEDRTIEVLHDAVVNCCGPNGWDLYSQSDAISQQLKALSECGEACDSVNKGDSEQLKDDIGDIIVCLINWAKIEDHDFMADWRANGTALLCDSDKWCARDLTECVAMNCYIKDNLGSMICFLKELAARFGLCPVECLGVSYDVISKRKGRMINGTFVKDLVLQ